MSLLYYNIDMHYLKLLFNIFNKYHILLEGNIF